MTFALIYCLQLLQLFTLNSASLPVAGSQTLHIPDSTAVLYIITGSDWCPECRQLEKVLEDHIFTDALAEYGVELVIVDFPQRKKLDKKTVSRNQQIAKQFGFEGVFPTFILSIKDRHTQRLYRHESAAELSQSILHEFDKLRE